MNFPVQVVDLLHFLRHLVTYLENATKVLEWVVFCRYCILIMLLHQERREAFKMPKQTNKNTKQTPNSFRAKSIQNASLIEWLLKAFQVKMLPKNASIFSGPETENLKELVDFLHLHPEMKTTQENHLLAVDICRIVHSTMQDWIW